MSIKTTLMADIKEAMRARDKQRLDALRLISAAFKQVEVDERIELDDARALALLNKLAKQRQESLTQFEQAGRADLVQKEQFELDILSRYLPEPLSDEEINQCIDEAFKATGAESIRDMGKLMGYLKPRLQGRADLAKVNVILKEKLSS